MTPSRQQEKQRRAVVEQLDLIPEELKAERANYSSTPNVRGMEAAAARIVELFGVSVTRSFVKFHCERSKKLSYHKISGNRYFSDRDLWDLIVIRTRDDSVSA